MKDLKPTCRIAVVQAAPVLFDKKVVEESPYGQAVVINAGIANACTGREDTQDRKSVV